MVNKLTPIEATAITIKDDKFEKCSLNWSNLVYKVESKKVQLVSKCPKLVRSSRTILNDVSGSAKPGHVTAILGPSGSGKSTLLECLFGKRRTGLTGTVHFTGQSRTGLVLISQEDFLLEHLTVRETLSFASKIKCEPVFAESKSTDSSNPVRTVRGKDAHAARVNHLIGQLMLANCSDTRISKCSGGQRKRVSIGCELISRPAIVVLDEPTSGLDSWTCLQCIQILRNLVDNSDQGLAILLTIHQPSSRILELFDHLYMLSSQGNLAYSGQPGQLVSHLASCGIECPKYTNPSELAIELASGQFGDDPLGLSVKLASAKVESTETGPRPTGHRHVRSRVRHLKHFKTLLWRNFIMMLRDPVLTSTQLAAHLFVALIVSLMYGPQVGQVDGCNAKTVFDVPHPLDPASLVRTNENVSLILFSLMFLSFTSMMPTILTIPKEIAVFRKEHTNGWYSVILYYLARLVVDLPFQFAFPTLYCVIVYLMTGQLDGDDRIFLFVAACCAMSLVSQSIGIVIGTAFPDSINLIVFLAPIVTIPGFLFSGFFVRLRSMPPSLKPFSYLSYVKYSFESVLLSVYGFDRCRRYTGTSSLTSGAREAILVEPEVTQNATVGAFDVHKAYQYRYYHSKPFSYVLNEYAASDTSYWTCLSMLGVFFIILRLVSLILLYRQANSKL